MEMLEGRRLKIDVRSLSNKGEAWLILRGARVSYGNKSTRLELWNPGGRDQDEEIVILPARDAWAVVELHARG